MNKILFFMCLQVGFVTSSICATESEQTYSSQGNCALERFLGVGGSAQILLEKYGRSSGGPVVDGSLQNCEARSGGPVVDGSFSPGNLQKNDEIQNTDLIIGDSRGRLNVGLDSARIVSGELEANISGHDLKLLQELMGAGENLEIVNPYGEGKSGVSAIDLYLDNPVIEGLNYAGQRFRIYQIQD